LLTFGVMGLLTIRINFYNLVVMPAVVGLGIDASIHLWHSRKHGAIGATSKGAIYSALTTAGAFAGLLVARHAGLRSIGTLGVVATLACVAVAIVALGWPREKLPPK
jgi:predicted RND superfamily exporter protein